MSRHHRFLLLHTAVQVCVVVLSLWGPTLERMWHVNEQTSLQQQVDELKAELALAQQAPSRGMNDDEHHALMRIHHTLTEMHDVIEKALGGSPSA